VPSSRTNPPPPEILALRPIDAARVLGIPLRTLWTWIHDGKLQVARPSGKVTLVLMHSIKKLLGE
jgi:excisionase family DNA binding protein